MNQKRSITVIVLGLLLIDVGLAVFGIRLLHDGPYVMPHGAAVYCAFALFILGGFLIWHGTLRRFGWVALLVSPIAIFPALYSIMGESEEVISLYTANAQGEDIDLRLWIVDREDGAWVGMSRAKAVDHSLDGAQLQMLRAGQMQCVVPKLFEDRETVSTIHQMKVDKYKVAQISGALGLYPLEATDSTVVLRFDPCGAQVPAT